MKRGLVLGKFSPLHKGHIELINYARQHCGELTVLICSTESEPISGLIRLGWIEELYKNDNQIKPIHVCMTKTICRILQFLQKQFHGSGLII